MNKERDREHIARTIEQLQRERDEAREAANAQDKRIATLEAGIEDANQCIRNRNARIAELERERDEAQAALTAGLEYHEQLKRERDEARERVKELDLSCNRMFGESHVMVEKYNQLRTAIGDAPHNLLCAATNLGKRAPCDCWKSKALRDE